MNLKASEASAVSEPLKASKTKAAKKPQPSKAKAFDTALAQAGYEARRRAAAILEVLAGTRKPSEAAQALGLGSMRYYTLERRAIQALVEGCQAPPRGRTLSPEHQLYKLQKQIRRLERENARYVALARVAQRAVQLAPPPPLGKSASGARKVRRRPPVRALKMVDKLTGAAAPAEHTPTISPAAPGAAASKEGVIPMQQEVLR